ncbi:MAG: hypothetical protein JKX83_04560 [Pseudomonadales bacterium]|nr:hypothetical protein [Pseudomonadales bacterium]
MLAFPENNPFKTKKLAERVYFTMALISLEQLLEFQKHRKKNEHHWRDLHQLYAYARANKLLEHVVEFSAFGAIASDIEALYLQVSVLAISDPYQMLPEQVMNIWCYLAQHSNLATVLELESHFAPDSGFVINLTSDKKPQSYRWFDQAIELLALDLEPLTTLLKSHVKQLEARPEAHIAGLENTLRNSKQPLLTQLAKTWLQTSERTEERVETKKEVDCTYSVRDIHYVASHATEVIDEVRRQLNDQIEGVITDESTSGACILLKKMPKHSLEPGQIVLLYENKDGAITAPKLATVRWNTNDPSGHEIHLGLKYIPGQIYPMAVNAKDNVTVDSYPRYGLLLQAISGKNESWQIITTPGLYHEKRKLAISFDDQSIEQPAQTGQLLMSSKHVQLFSVEILSTSSN